MGKQHKSHKSHKSVNTSKTKKLRPSPIESATSLPEGSIRRGGNNGKWVIKETTNGTGRWMPIENIKLNGWQLLTVDYLEKHIGKSIDIYDTEYSDKWPTKSAKMYKWKFTPNGDANVNRKKTNLIGWLKTRKPAVLPGQIFSVLGDGEFPSVQIDSKYSNIASSNVMNIMSFVKCVKNK
uniref:Uncharacterized protein n=1 Tax=viral metagenome TaxID=1070528 RepID=A0A6C0HN62_9ZZZZ